MNKCTLYAIKCASKPRQRSLSKTGKNVQFTAALFKEICLTYVYVISNIPANIMLIRSTNVHIIHACKYSSRSNRCK